MNDIRTTAHNVSRGLNRLNRRQTRALVIGICIFIFFGVFPPWYQVYINELGGERIEFGGYGSLSAPPVPDNKFNWYAAHIHFPMLLIHWVIVAAATAAAVYYLHDNVSDSKLYERYRSN